MKPLLAAIKKEDICNKIDSFKVYEQYIEVWGHPQVWTIKHKECYSDWFLQEIDQIKNLVIKFAEEGYSNIRNKITHF